MNDPPSSFDSTRPRPAITRLFSLRVRLLVLVLLGVLPELALTFGATPACRERGPARRLAGRPADANRMLKRNLILLGLVGVLALAAAWFGSDWVILRRVRALVQATGRLEAGDLGARTGIR